LIFLKVIGLLAWTLKTNFLKFKDKNLSI